MHHLQKGNGQRISSAIWSSLHVSRLKPAIQSHAKVDDFYVPEQDCKKDAKQREKHNTTLLHSAMVVDWLWYGAKVHDGPFHVFIEGLHKTKQRTSHLITIWKKPFVP